ncbi:hypothetical protein TcasGA2_TC012879 [Tribolium castaneum]|uniref:Uncharacterized protein n=1 Tax=Tribolium castaneum TaxID=7070 RepID=D6X1D6_TRICA|nr:hypothetical protein TcasGA2_TC012879 [Tribolium castaneum]
MDDFSSIGSKCPPPYAKIAFSPFEVGGHSDPHVWHAFRTHRALGQLSATTPTDAHGPLGSHGLIDAPTWKLSRFGEEKSDENVETMGKVRLLVTY